MQISEELLEQLKKHVEAIKVAMPELSKEERMKIITKAITDSTDIQKEQKEETIQLLSQLND